MNVEKIQQTVAEIFQDVTLRGDEALREYTLKFDGVDQPLSCVNTRGIEAGDRFDGVINRTRIRIATYHQGTALKSFEIHATGGAKIENRVFPIESVGLYVPGGKAPLISTLMMLAVPALIAKVPRIAICTPPGRSGRISPFILRACELLGLEEVYAVGGAQAIAALSIGTKTIPQVEKIFGPGNDYVTEAKRQAQMSPWNRAVDMIAGPSELVAVVEPDQDFRLAGAELMTQVEHGQSSWAIALTLDSATAADISRYLDEAFSSGLLSESERSRIKVESSASQAEIESRVRELAPEHLALYVKEPSTWTRATGAAGAVYIGPKISAVHGDYGIGSNHTLPTSSSSLRSSGLSVRDFQRTVTVVSATGALDSVFLDDVAFLAKLEQMNRHLDAVQMRAFQLEET